MRSRKLSVACIVALTLCGVVAVTDTSPAATLTGMAVTTEGDVTRIHVTLDGSVDIHHFSLADPPRLFVDCRGVDQVGPDVIPTGAGLAHLVETSVWKGEGQEALTRLAVHLTGPARSEVERVTDGFVITLHPDSPTEWTGHEESAAPAEGTSASSEVHAEDSPEGSHDVASEGTHDVASETAHEVASEGTHDAASETSHEVHAETSHEVHAETPASASSPAPTTVPPGADDFEFTPYNRPQYASGWERNAPAVTSFEEATSKGLAARGGPRVSLDIQGAEIYTVLRSLSEYSGVNIVMGYDVREKVTEPVSFHLVDVPWGEALELILRSAHLWYREESGIIRVDTEENLRKEELDRGSADRAMEQVLPLTTRIVEVIYATGKELAPSISKTLTQRGHVEVDERTNSLVVTDIPSKVEAAVEMIQHLDSQTPQVEIVAKLVDVDSRYSKELGVLWNISGVHEGGASAEGSFGANDLVEAAADVRFGVVRSWGTVSAVISALEKDNKANIISNPRITTVNNREARILVGKKIPLITLDEAGNPVTELTTIGITLRVTPHINDNNRITMDLHPEVSDLSSQATVQGGVIINTSEADTRVMVENGQTAVIGGLIRSNVTSLNKGVPILKDIPLLGALFRGTQEVDEKRELIIFVTPRIITSFAAVEESNGQ